MRFFMISLVGSIEENIVLQRDAESTNVTKESQEQERCGTSTTAGRGLL